MEILDDRLDGADGVLFPRWTFDDVLLVVLAVPLRLGCGLVNMAAVSYPLLQKTGGEW